MTFVSRTLKPSEINYGMVEKEVLALLKFVDVCYVMLVSREMKALLDLQPLLGWSNLRVSTGGWEDGPRCRQIGLWKLEDVRKGNMKYSVPLRPA